MCCWELQSLLIELAVVEAEGVEKVPLPQHMDFIHPSRHLHVATTARMAKCPFSRPPCANVATSFSFISE